MLALEGERERPGEGEGELDERGVGGATLTGKLADAAESGGAGDTGDAGETMRSSVSAGGSANEGGIGGGLKESSSFSGGWFHELGHWERRVVVLWLRWGLFERRHGRKGVGIRDWCLSRHRRNGFGSGD